MRTLLLREVREDPLQLVVQVLVVRHREREGKRIGKAIEAVPRVITG